MGAVIGAGIGGGARVLSTFELIDPEERLSSFGPARIDRRRRSDRYLPSNKRGFAVLLLMVPLGALLVSIKIISDLGQRPAQPGGLVAVPIFLLFAVLLRATTDD